MRRPLVDRTGWRRYVAEHRGARLFDPYDADDLASALLELENPRVRETYSEGARRMAAFLQSQELIDRTVRFYREVAER